MTAPNGRAFSDEDLLDQFRESEDPFLTSPELAEEFDVSRQWMNDRLRALWKAGELERKPCAAGYAYWLESSDSGSSSA